MIVVSHPTGNTFVRALLGQLESAGLLQAFYTTLALQPDDWALQLLPARLRAQAARRAYDVPAAKLKRFPLREAVRHAAPRLGLSRLARHERGPASLDAVYRDLDRRLARALPKLSAQGASAVYCYEDGALATFEAARKLGLARFYELPIAYWETSARLLAEEAERYPAWEPTLVGTRDSPAKLRRKTRELEWAQTVVVPGQFVFDSLPDWARESKTCVIAPFGSPTIDLAPDATFAHSESRPLRVLFAGSMTQRKGLADLFAAMKLLGRADIELVVFGSPIAPLEFYRAQGVPFRHEASRPHAQVLALMRSCDLLVLPSIVEGRALVQQEALACGLPLLVTSNAGGQDLIDEGETGWLVPIRAPENIAEKLNWLADNRAVLPAMREYARRKAAHYTWRAYGQIIVAAVREHGH